SDSKVQWDQHSDLKNGHEKNAREVDLPIVGLLQDLKSRGLLDDTLLWWGGEFGRTPVVEGKNGRDHNPEGFTMWLPAAACKAACVTAAPTTTAITPRRKRSTSTTCTPRF